MTNETIAVFQEIKDFIGFTDDDVASLKALAPVFAADGAALTDMFYVKLERDPEQRRLIEGRVEALKRTHNRWMAELFAGEYGEGYVRIALVENEHRIRDGAGQWRWVLSRSVVHRNASGRVVRVASSVPGSGVCPWANS